MIGLSCISLFRTGPELDKFCAKTFTFGSTFLSLNEILVAVLLAITAADRFFKRLCGSDTKRETLPVLHVCFLDMIATLLKVRIICSRKISVFMSKSSVYFSAHPLSASAPSLRLLWRWYCLARSVKKRRTKKSHLKGHSSQVIPC